MTKQEAIEWLEEEYEDTKLSNYAYKEEWLEVYAMAIQALKEQPERKKIIVNKNKKLYVKICPICKEKFVADHQCRKYCSLECADIYNKNKRKKWREDNPHYYRDYMKKYRERGGEEE